MLQIILYQPQIPPNTGNIIRLCANGGATLHLIEPLGFSLDEKACRRAGLDYQDMANVIRHENWQACFEALAGRRIWAVTKFGTTRYDEAAFGPDDCLLFGTETTGLPPEIHEYLADSQKLTIPMASGNRSLNLSNSVALVFYEAWRQQDFAGASPYDPALG